MRSLFMFLLLNSVCKMKNIKKESQMEIDLSQTRDRIQNFHLSLKFCGVVYMLTRQIFVALF